MSDKAKLPFRDLKRVCIGYALLKILSIPVLLFIATCISETVTYAVNGNVDDTLSRSTYVVIFTVILVVVRVVFETKLRRQTSLGVANCRFDFLTNVLQNPIDKLFKAQHGELIENLSNDIEALAKRYTTLLPTIISSFVAVFAYVIFIGTQSVLVAITLLAVSLIQLIPPVIVKKYMKINYDDCRTMEAKITDHVAEAVNGFETIKLYSLKNWWASQLEVLHADYLRIGAKSDALASVQIAMYKLLDNILRFGTYALLGFYVMTNVSSVEVAIQAIYLSSELFSSIKSLFSIIPDFAISNSAENRLTKWCIPFSNRMQPIAIRNHDITLDSLCYGYDDNQLLSDLNISLSNKKNYLIVGENGVGKSTLLNLLAGILKPTKGSIQIGDLALAKCGDWVYSTEILYVPQNDPEYSFDAQALVNMMDAAKRKMIIENAQKLGVCIQELSGKAIRDLSGGERKKLFLAIAFAKDSTWLLLDEPTNNLDAFGKNALCEMITAHSGIIVVTHDPVLNDSVDTILQIENGQVRYEDK